MLHEQNIALRLDLREEVTAENKEYGGKDREDTEIQSKIKRACIQKKDPECVNAVRERIELREDGKHRWQTVQRKERTRKEEERHHEEVHDELEALHVF